MHANSDFFSNIGNTFFICNYLYEDKNEENADKICKIRPPLKKKVVSLVGRGKSAPAGSPIQP